jgi:signal peptidase II
VTTPQERARHRHRSALVAAAVVLIVAADQATKSYAVARWSDVPQQIIGNDVELFVTRNSGSAFSRFQNLTPLLAIGATVVAIVLARAARKESDRITLYALVLLLGGALGNLSDRFFRAPSFLHGSVVDFVRVGWWPVFNVADSCVTIGAVLLIARGIFPPREPAAAATDPATDTATDPATDAATDAATDTATGG